MSDCSPKHPSVSLSVEVMLDVLNERQRQDNKWGYNRDHRDDTGLAPDRQMAEWAKSLCDLAAQNGDVTWRSILFEEVYEAFAESDLEKLREELIQVAAVAVAWVEALDRRGENAG